MGFLIWQNNSVVMAPGTALHCISIQRCISPVNMKNSAPHAPTLVCYIQYLPNASPPLTPWLVMACLQDWKSCWRFVWAGTRLEGFWSKWHQTLYEYIKSWALLIFKQPWDAYDSMNSVFIGFDSHSYPIWHKSVIWINGHLSMTWLLTIIFDWCFKMDVLFKFRYLKKSAHDLCLWFQHHTDWCLLKWT